jgi:hypothetical protein
VEAAQDCTRRRGMRRKEAKACLATSPSHPSRNFFEGTYEHLDRYKGTGVNNVNCMDIFD